MVSINPLSKEQLSLSKTPVVAHAKKPSQPSLAESLKNLFRHVIYWLSCHRLCPSVPLTDRDIVVINKFKNRKLYAFPKTNSSVTAQPATEAVKPQFNETLEGMRQFARDMVEMTIHCVQKEYITTPVTQLSDATADLPHQLKEIAKQAIIIGSKTAKPIFDALQNFQVEDTAMEQINKVLIWISEDIKPEEKGEFKNLLEQKIQEFAPEKAPQGAEQQYTTQQLNHCADKVLDWFFNSDHSQTPYKLFENDPQAPSEEIVQRVVNTCLQILVEKKIDYFTNKYHSVLQKDLPAIVEKTVRTNALKITDALSTRMAEVLQNMGDEQFTVLFDKIVEIAGKHVTNITSSYEEAEQAAKDHQALKEHAEKIVRRTPKNENERIIYKKCEEYLKNLKKKGGIPGIQEDVLLSTFLRLSGNDAPCIDNTITNDISELIWEALLPSVIKDGKTVNGLENLLSKIELPQQCKDFLNEAKEIAEKIISKESFNELEALVNTAGDFKELALDGCKEVLKLGLNEAIDIVVKQMSKPEELNLVLANSALPSATETMIKFFADDLFQANVKKMAPYIQKLVDGNDKEGTEKELFSVLFKIATRKAPQFKFTLADEEDFKRIVKPRIQEIVELFNEIKQKKKEQWKPDLKTTIAIIKEYYSYQTNSKENNPHFADFIHASLHTGEFGPVLPRMFDLNLTRNMVSKMVTNSVQTYRKTYRTGLNTAIPMARENYYKKEVVEKWIKHYPKLESIDADIKKLKKDIEKLEYEIEQLKKKNKDTNDVAVRENTRKIGKLTEKLTAKQDLRVEVIDENTKHEKELQEARKNLSVQVDKAARLGHDIIMFKAEQVPVLGILCKFIIKRILGPTADKIRRVVLTLFNRIIGRQAFNEHLLSKIFLTSVTGIHMTTKAAPGTRPLLQKDSQEAFEKLKVPVSAVSIHAKPFTIDIVQPKPSRLKRIVLSVMRAFETLFLSFKHRKMTLDEKELQVLSYFAPKKKPLEGKANQKNGPSSIDANEKNPVEPAKTEANLEKKEAIKKREHLYFKEENPDLNSSLKKVGEFVSNFMKKLGDEVYKEKIEKPLAQFKDNAEELPEQVHKVLDWLSKTIAPLTTTIFSKVVAKGHEFELDETSRSFFHILFKNLKDGNGRIQLSGMKESLEKVNENLGLNLSREELQNYIAPLSRWMTQDYTNKEEIKSLKGFIENNQNANFHYDERIMPKFFVAAIQWLVSYNIEHKVAGALPNFLENDLSKLIKDHLNNNMEHLSKLFFNRIAGLLNNITDEEYKKLFDECASDIDGQMKNLIKAKSELKKQNLECTPDSIAKELTSGKIDPQTGEPLYDLHNLAKACLNPPEQVKNNDRELENYRKLEEKRFIEPLVEKMIKLALPTDPGKGADALEELLESIFIEPEIKEKIDELHQFIKSLLPSKYADMIDVAEKKFMKLTKTFVLNSLKQQTKKILTERLRESFKIISDAEKRQEFLADSFPIMQKQLVGSFANLIVSSSEPAKLFKRMIEGEENPQTKAKLTEDIYNLCKDNFKHSWESLSITQQNFKDNYFPEIQKGLTSFILKDFIYSPASPDFADFKRNHYIDLKNFVKSANEQNINLKDPEAAVNDGGALARINGALTSKFIHKHGELDRNTFRNDRDGSKARHCFDHHIEPFIRTICAELQEKQKIEKRAILDDVDIEAVLKQYFNEENDGNKQYAEMIGNMVKMGNFGGTFNKLLVFFTGNEKAKGLLTQVLVPALNPVRNSLRGTMDLTADGLNANFLNDNYVKNLVNPPTKEALTERKNKIEEKIKRENDDINDLEPTDPKAAKHIARIDALTLEKARIDEGLRAAQEKIDAEPRRQEDIKNRFDKGLELTTRMLYDLIEYAVRNTATKNDKLNKIITWGWHQVADYNHEHLLEATRAIYDTFFENHYLNEALQVKMLEKTLNLVERKNSSEIATAVYTERDSKN